MDHAKQKKALPLSDAQKFSVNKGKIINILLQFIINDTQVI